MKRRPLTLPALSLSLVLALAACGSDMPESTVPGVSATGTETQDDTTTAEGPTDDAGQTTGDDAQTTGDDPAGASSEVPAEVVAAIRTAEDEAGGTAYEIDDQDNDGSWEIDVAVGNRSVEVTVSADGTQVLEVDDDDDLDDDDRRGLEAAQISLVDALGIALAERPGTLDDAELDEERGTFVWEVTIDTEQRDDVEVYVDVTTGEIVRIDG